ETGRWLVRYSPDRCSVLIGLALLAMDRGEDDIELIQIVGLLSDTFGWLAADALKRRFGGEALVWLAERISGSSRIQVVETLCLPGSSASRSWLLRRSCQRDFYDAYYAGTVATTAHLHEAIIADDVDDELVDHTGRLLLSMAGASGMGMTWESYPPIRIVLDAYIRQLARRTPSAERYLNAARLLDNLVTHEPDGFSFTTEQRDDVVNRYLWMLHRPNWTEAVRAGIDPNDVHLTRFVRTVAPRLGLPALIVLDDER
ncbi:MAG: hypothetical protein JWN03_4264, partial [Nocardia sp.]|uniref:hypothetical protein n=1 Tax=Nocardia sp. TaxID=1821 RepID=UPI00260E5F45